MKSEDRSRHPPTFCASPAVSCGGDTTIASEENTYQLRAEQLSSELARKQQFMAIVAHEMRNFLAPVANGIESLARADSATTIRIRQVMARQIAQMKRLVDDLLDIVCAEEGRMSLYLAPIDLREVITAALDVAQPAIAAQEHRLVTVPDLSAPAIVHGDRCRLTQVVSNLLLNAAKFTPKGGEIRVCLEHEGPCVTICIRDTGIGIAADMLPKIFDVYERAQQEPMEVRSGLGLGLAVARHLVESHGGTLCAYSGGPGKGSEFVMRLPAA